VGLGTRNVKAAGNHIHRHETTSPFDGTALLVIGKQSDKPTR